MCYVSYIPNFAVTSLGDFNGDGLADLAVSAPSVMFKDQYNIGAVYVVFGHANGHAFHDLNVSNTNNTYGLNILGESSYSQTGT